VPELLKFWFDELTPKDWFAKSDATDELIRHRFLALFEKVSATANGALLDTPQSALAAVIVLDQFPRNMFRDTPQAFATDPKALQLAKVAVSAGLDAGVVRERRVFLYLPYEHSENLSDQHRSVALISALADASYTRYAEAHRDVIEQFGRFPHRNAILARASTPEELTYLAQPGSGF